MFLADIQNYKTHHATIIKREMHTINMVLIC